MNETQTPPAGKVWSACGRCSGKGTIRGFGHVAGGVCFACKGTGGRWVTAAAKAKRESAKAAKAAEKEAARVERMEESMRQYREQWTDTILSDIEDENVPYMFRNIWQGHEDHPNYPGPLFEYPAPLNGAFQ